MDFTALSCFARSQSSAWISVGASDATFTQLFLISFFGQVQSVGLVGRVKKHAYMSLN